MTYGDADYDLKIRMHRFLWNQGYFVRREVAVSSYILDKGSILKREDVTDIDVLALKFDENLEKDIVLCDCKSGKKIKALDRVFWLKGLMNYFDSRRGYLILGANAPYLSKRIAPDLKINVLDGRRLYEIENISNNTDTWLGSYDPELEKSLEEFKKEIKKKYYKQYFYVKYRYWQEEPYNQIKRLINIGVSLRDKTQKPTNAEKWFIAEIVVLFSIACNSFAGQLYNFGSSNIINQVVSQWHGGEMEKERSEELTKQVYSLVSNLIKESSRKKGHQLKLKDMSPEPEYVSKNLVEVTSRILNNYKLSREVPRFLDFIVYEFMMKNEKIRREDIAKVFGVGMDPFKMAKLAKNSTKFYFETTKLDETVFKELFGFG